MKKVTTTALLLLLVGAILLLFQGTKASAADNAVSWEAQFSIALTAFADSRATVELTNRGTDSPALTFLLASYRSDGRMEQSESVTMTLAPDDKAALSIVCGEKTALLKAFVLESDSCRPLREAWSCEDFRTAFQDGPSDILVAYFSCTNHTAQIAEAIAEATGATLYRILPEIPYTAADLNYSDSSTRATAEQSDPNARPGISDALENMADYDVIFLGYPIWWGQAPKIMYTFVEAYDLSGKTIIPFCTSGSSPIGSSATNLSKSAPNAEWKEGRRFPGSAAAETVALWAKEMLPASPPAD